MQAHKPPLYLSLNGLLASVLVITFSVLVKAQSTSSNHPLAVTSDELRAEIKPRDIGDPRPTAHFYSLTAGPGDLIIEVSSSQFLGDIDLFTDRMRPLLKLSVYGDLPSISKTIFLRKREQLLLRVEGRAGAEAVATYSVRFGGSFTPLPSTALESSGETEKEQPPTQDGRVNQRDRTFRVSSVGARIIEPAQLPTPMIDMETTALADLQERRLFQYSATLITDEEVGEAPEVPAIPAKEVTFASLGSLERTSSPESESNIRSAESASLPKTSEQSKPHEIEAGKQPDQAKLVIETRDGKRTEKWMKDLRRVTVEKYFVILIRNDGYIERVPMSSVLKLTIEYGFDLSNSASN
jgi:hypothetical protein